MKLADELAPYLRPGRSPRGLDVLSGRKATCLNTVFFETPSKLNDDSQVLGPNYIKLPSNTREMAHLIKGMENKYGFPQAFGCIDGTHIEIMKPTENPHDYFSYKQKYTINPQSVCDWKGVFIDVEVKWPGSVCDGRVFGNSKAKRCCSGRKRCR